jgi:hypothetical protein
MIGSFIARPVGLALTGPVAGLVGFHAWLAVVAGVIVVSTAAALVSPAVRGLERRDGAGDPRLRAAAEAEPQAA